MGRTKATLEINGVAMALLVADALAAAGCVPVVAYGGDRVELASLAMPVLADDHPGEGPLGGVLGALELFEHESSFVFVAACDLPGLTAGAVLPMIEAARSRRDVDVVVARTNAVEPMCAIWNTSATPRVRHAFLGGQRALHAVIAELDSFHVAVDPGALRNINTRDDLDRYP